MTYTKPIGKKILPIVLSPKAYFSLHLMEQPKVDLARQDDLNCLFYLESTAVGTLANALKALRNSTI